MIKTLDVLLILSIQAFLVEVTYFYNNVFGGDRKTTQKNGRLYLRDNFMALYF